MDSDLTDSCSFLYALRTHLTHIRLDEAELALYGRDDEKKGELSKEQLHSLMQQHLKVTGELKTVKRVVYA